MDIAEILRHILIVLIAAKVAAELAERIGIPAVVGEIVAGIAIGPSLLNIVGNGGGDEVLRTLGELGVILLLLDVGLEMDLRELGRVGRTSFQVATIGVVAPLALGIVAMQAMGNDFTTSLFVGAALTATSVGITARVFGDLKALATTEARIVLGAAVADDVMGLVVLTVVVRLAADGSVSVLSVAGIVAVAVLFLVVGGLGGLRLGPPLFGLIERVSRSSGTMVALALAFTLAFAELADAARLAPIVGAFVAGIALSKSRQADQIRRELLPVGHLFIPVFFLQIGIDADVDAFMRASVLRDAALLLAVAVVGKLISPLGAIGAPGDKILIGLGMLPRGEVGLIFATIGLQQGVLGPDIYAALLLVVLITTLAAPQLLKLRYSSLRGKVKVSATEPDAPTPDGGWLRVGRDDVDLAGRPPDSLVVPLALDAALALARRRPTDALVDWLNDASPPPVTWNERLTAKLLDVMEFGTARSWRFLEVSGVLEHTLPEVADALHRRARDPFSLDPLAGHRLTSLERRRQLVAEDPLAVEMHRLDHPDHLVLALFLVEVFDAAANPSAAARATLRRLKLPDTDARQVQRLVDDRDLLWSASHQPRAMTEEAVLQLADHLDSPEEARQLYVLSALRDEGRERWEVQRLRSLYELIQVVLADDDLTGNQARSLAEQRRQTALAFLDGSPGSAQRLATAPRAYVLRTPPETMARHALLLEPPPSPLKVGATPTDDGRWWVDVSCRDQPGLLASITHALADHSLSVVEAVLATWEDGEVLDSFLVEAPGPLDAPSLRASLMAALDDPASSPPLPEAQVTFDGAASPWHTICEVVVDDRVGVLHAVSTAFAAAGILVRAARVSTEDALVIDRFEVTDHDGAKLTGELEARFRDLLRSGVTARRRRFGRRLLARAQA